jgi:hypothetical protein
MTVTSSGGKLHGTWTSENTVTGSDRRLKRDIAPLYGELVKIVPPTTKEKKLLNSGDVLAAQHSGMMRILNELRPVSYKYKSQSESKYSRYGFIAQEMEDVLPHLVTSNSDGFLALRLDDLIAVLTLGIQSLDTKVLHVEAKLGSLTEKVDTNYLHLADRLKSIETVIRKLVVGRKKRAQFEKNTRLISGKQRNETNINSTAGSSDLSENVTSRIPQKHIEVLEVFSGNSTALVNFYDGAEPTTTPAVYATFAELSEMVRRGTHVVVDMEAKLRQALGVHKFQSLSDTESVWRIAEKIESRDEVSTSADRSSKPSSVTTITSDEGTVYA